MLNGSACEAAQSGEPNTLQQIVTINGATTAKDSAGMTLLHHAAQSNPNLEVLRLLIAAGAIVDARDNLGATALDLAVRRPVAHAPIVQLLLDSGTRVNALERPSPLWPMAFDFHFIDREPLEPFKTPMRWAAEFNADVTIVELLLKARAKVDPRDKTSGGTLCAFAAHPDPAIL